MTSDQADGESGEWMMLCRECVTASSFGEIAKSRTSSSPAPVVTKLLYSKHFITPAMQYGTDNEPVACEAYIAK